MGIAAEISFYLGEADEYFYSNYRATYYYNPGYFFAADSWKRIGEPTEKTNKIWWVSPPRSACEIETWQPSDGQSRDGSKKIKNKN